MRPDITLFQDLHRELCAAIRDWGASADAAPVWATVIMLVAILIVALLLLAILRAGFKGRIKETTRKCEALKAEKKQPPPVSRPTKRQTAEVFLSSDKPKQIKSSRAEGQLELLADLRERGKISQEEYSRQRMRILEDV
jgi:uncharacterized membrane protein